MARNLTGRLGTPLERFFRKVNKTSSCWEWTAAKSPKGYGYFNAGVGVDDVWMAHRYSYLVHYKNDPGEYYVCHTCDNPGCVNPSHLFLGTQKDNMQDCLRKGRRPGKLSAQQKLDVIKDTRKLLDIAKDYNISFQLVSRMKRQSQEITKCK